MLVLPDIYFELHYLRYRKSYSGWRRLLWWMPSIIMLSYTIGLVSIHNFVPTDIRWLYVYLLLIGVLFVPKAVFALSSFLGWRHGVFHHTHKNWGNPVGGILSLITVLAFLYGLVIGPRTFKVRHLDIYLDHLPKAFDGYKIVHFSDAHVGTFNYSFDRYLRRDIDSIEAQHADLIVFTGDLQNLQPGELKMHENWYRELGHQKKSLMVSVMGNHDYSDYYRGTPAEMASRVRQMEKLQRSFGWKLLLNENEIIRRGKSSIYLAGGEYENSKTDTLNYVNRTKMYEGISQGAFVIELQHNPIHWEQNIAPEKGRILPQLTLSGHTHGGQISIFGIRPTMLFYNEDYGLYEKNDKYIYVTSGIGGLVPFRLGSTPEIAVITLHCFKK